MLLYAVPFLKSCLLYTSVSILFFFDLFYRANCTFVPFQFNHNRRLIQMARSWDHTHIGKSATPVSYTHLDVYKRQGISFACYFYIILIRVDAERNVGRKGPRCGGPCQDVRDVYKRQAYRPASPAKAIPQFRFPGIVPNGAPAMFRP